MTSNLSPDDRAELNELWDLLRRAQVRIERLLGDDDSVDIGDRDDVAGLPVPDGVECAHRTEFGRRVRPTNSPAGFASTERRARQVNGRPGSNQGEAGTRGPASPTLRVGVA